MKRTGPQEACANTWNSKKENILTTQGLLTHVLGHGVSQEEVAIQVHVWEKRKLRTSEMAAFDSKYPWVPSLTVDRPRSRRPPPVSKPIHRHLKGIDNQDSLPSF